MLIPLAIAGATCNKSPQSVENNGEGQGGKYEFGDEGVIRTFDADGCPAWSSTNWIAYLHSDNLPDNPDENGIYLIRPDGTEKHIIYPDRGYMRRFTWSPDGQWLMFGNDNMLIKIFHDGSITDTILTGLSSPYPKWSPDGEKITYHINSGDSGGIWLVNSDGLNKKRLIQYGLQQDWPYPDSIFYSNFDWDYPIGAVCIADTQGNLARIVYDPEDRFIPGTIYPQVNTMTRTMLFEAQVPTELGTIWIMDLDDPDISRLTTDEDAMTDPCFSPDGKHIVCVKNEHVGYHGGARLWIMDADGSNRRQLTF